MTGSHHPLDDTIFHWSCFTKELNFLPFESKFDSPVAAEKWHNFKDGEIAFDNGMELRHLLFGIYYSNGIYTADKWDRKRKDLVGAAGILNFEWEQWADPYDIPEDIDEDADIFREDWVFARLDREVNALNEMDTKQPDTKKPKRK